MRYRRSFLQPEMIAMGMTWKGSEFVTQRGRDSRLLGAEGGDRSHEKTMRVADGTADTETGQLLIIKLCLCHIFLLNYKCLNISHFHNSTVFYTIVCYQSQSIHTQPTITADTTPYSIKRCLCPITFCNYKCLNMFLSVSSTLFLCIHI